MKKISEELYKTYFHLIILFAISYIGILLFFISYIDRDANGDLRALDSFITHEVSEFDKKIHLGKTLPELFDDALEECPDILGTNVIFLYKGQIFVKNDEDLKILDKVDLEEHSGKIRSYGYFNYQYLTKYISVKGKAPIYVILLKDMRNERRMVVNLLIVSLIIGFITLYAGVNISRKFYAKFEDSLKKLKHTTNSINLDTLGDKFTTDNNFIEFDTIMSSYKKMLKRLKDQTDVQIDFVNNASHELKTPIFIISGYINMIKRWGLENKEITKEAITAIDDEVKTMSKLMTKLLFLAKGDVNEIDNSKIEIVSLFNEIIQELSIIYPKQEIDLDVRNIVIYSDEFLLRQLFLNLIENAIKYGKGQKITIRGFLDNGLRIEIMDRGEGIGEDDLKYIYDKFFRVDKGRSREMGSHGLGLAIVKKITEVLNIDINIVSKLDIGTRVILNIPLEK